MRHLLGLRLALTAAGAVIAISVAAGAGYDSELVLGTVVAGVALLITATQFTLVVPLQAELHVGRQAAAETLAQVVLVAVIVALVLAGAGIVPFLAAPILSGTVLLATTIVLVRGKAPLRPAFDSRAWRSVLRDTLPVGLTTAVHAVYFRSVILLMSVLAPSLQTGYFATSYRLIEVLAAVPVVLVGTTLPVVARAAHTDANRLEYATQRVLETALIAGVWIAATTAIGASFLIHLLAGDEGQAAAPVLRIQAVVLLFAFVSSSLGNVLLSRHRHRALLRCSATAFAVTAAVAVVLIPSLGAIGGAIAAASGEAALVIALALAVRRENLALWQSLAILPRVALATLAGIVLAMTVPVPSGIAAVIFTIVYGIVVVWSGAVPPEIRTALVRWPFRR